MTRVLRARTTIVFAVAAVFAGPVVSPPALAGQDVEVVAPSVILHGIEFSIVVRALTSLDTVPVTIHSADGRLLAQAAVPPVGEVMLGGLAADGNTLPLRVVAGAVELDVDRPLIPGWMSLLPPLVAIVLALIFREVVSSLLAGVWLGALLVTGFNPLAAVLRTVDRFIHPALADGDHAAIVIFSLLLGGMVGVMSRMGGTRAIVDAVTPLATSRRRGLFATWLAGLAIFFDDYANTLIVGNTMRPLTDKLKISRGKLAYIVDSTAAPVTVIMFVSTWVGFEIGLIGDGLQLAASQMSRDPAQVEQLQAASPFAVYLHTIPYLFYPILAIFTVALLIWTGRDFGPMLVAERRAASGAGVYRAGAQLAADSGAQLEEAPDGTPLHWWNGALPVLSVVITVLAGLVATGLDGLDGPRTIATVLGNADPFRSLLWGSLVGCLVAILLAVTQRILTVSQAVDGWVGGLRAMVMAMVILVLAWSLGQVTEAVGTAPFLSSILSDRMPMQLLPVGVFVVAALISFSTGTSWATMAILFPLVIPLAVAMGGGVDFDGGSHYTILLGGISSVMAGSIFGDHCSPISDTTVLSSMASGCDHVDHVRTQLPYALLIAGTGMVVGDIPTAFGLSPWIALPLGMAVIWIVIHVLGRRPDTA